MNSNKLIYSLLVFMIIFNIKILSRINLFIFLILVFLKLFYLLNPTNLWTVCVDDSLTPKQESFQYEYFENK